MLHKIACKLTNLVLKYEQGDAEDKEIYIYGFEVIVGKGITYIILILLGIVLGGILEMIIFISFAMLLRGYTGGYHLNNSLGCIVSTVTVSIISTFIAKSIDIQIASILIPFLLILSMICIFVLAPINHPNLQLTNQERKKCRSFSRRYLVLELIFVLLLLICNTEESIVISACLSIIFVAITMIIAKIIKQEVTYNE